MNSRLRSLHSTEKCEAREVASGHSHMGRHDGHTTVTLSHNYSVMRDLRTPVMLVHTLLMSIS